MRYKLFKAIIIILILLIPACAIIPPEMVDVVWYGQLKATIPPPKVIWDSSLYLNMEELGGVYFIDWVIYVVRRDKISESSFVHELMHAYMWLTYKVVDPMHLGPEWKRVKEINAYLASNGL